MLDSTLSEIFTRAQDHERAGRVAEAEAGYRDCLAANPRDPRTLYRLGVLAWQAEHADDAIALLRRAVAAEPTAAKYHSALGEILHHFGRFDAALAAHLFAAHLAPDDANVQFGLGLTRLHGENLDAALKAFATAVSLNPTFAEAYHAMGTTLQRLGRLDEAIASFRRAVELAPDQPSFHDSLVFTLHSHPDFGPAELCAEHAVWNARHAEPLRPLIRAHTNDRTPERRLRVGYISTDFRSHPVAYCLVPLFCHHDRSQFEIVAYASLRRPDAITQRLQACTDRWRDVTSLTDEKLTECILADGIDILIDLNLHTAENRLLVFARKPAPVQVTWGGYPASTGLTAIDYRLTDPYLDLPGASDRDSSEEPFRLPHSFWCYDPLATEPPVSPLPALTSGWTTFGCLCRFDKITPGAIQVWARILNAMPDSRLIVLAPHGSPRSHTLALFAQLGVNPTRIDLLDRRSRPEYLTLHHQIDVALDPFPYGGHTTLCDGLWMGVPAIALLGITPAARAGLSLLSNVGLPELVARDEADYVHIATELGRDLPRLAAIRAALRSRLNASPLMDAARFARGIEGAYRTMWRRWCAAV